jgi:hypothetical protein
MATQNAENLKLVDSNACELERSLDFLKTHSMTLRLMQRTTSCPPGDVNCVAGKHEHGIKYTAVFGRDPKSFPKTYLGADGIEHDRPRMFEMDVWPRRGDTCSVATVVRAMAEAITWPEDPDLVWEELNGNIRPSAAFAKASLSARFKKFLTADEYKDLARFR